MGIRLVDEIPSEGSIDLDTLAIKLKVDKATLRTALERLVTGWSIMKVGPDRYKRLL